MHEADTYGRYDTNNTIPALPLVCPRSTTHGHNSAEAGFAMIRVEASGDREARTTNAKRVHLLPARPRASV